MNFDLFILFAGGAHYAFPDALAFLFAILTGAAAERVERASRKNSRLGIPTALGAAVGLAVDPFLFALDFRFVDEFFLVRCAVGAIGGLLGAALVKARKKKKEI